MGGYLCGLLTLCVGFVIPWAHGRLGRLWGWLSELLYGLVAE